MTMREGYEAMSVEHARSGKEFGEAELMCAAWSVVKWDVLRTDSLRPVPIVASPANH